MNRITIDQVKDLKKHDRISITYLNKDGEEVTKNTRFHSVEGNIIIVYQPRKHKIAWEIEVGTECIINKI